MDTMRDPRYHAYAKVRCQKYGAGATALMALKNISKSGAKLTVIASTLQFSKGDILRLMVDLDSVQSVRIVNAEVVWTKAGSVGVAFVPPENVYQKLFERT